MERIKIVARDGMMVMRYTDLLSPRFKAQASQYEVKRASHVEPNENGEWTADMSPLNGPVLGPFTTRAAALKAEAEWIDARL